MDSIQDKLMQQFQNMDQVYEDYARSKGLNYLSLVVLEEIYELGEDCTQKKISEDIRYPKQSVNLVIRSFLQDGYVTLKELPTNRKVKQILLTEKGRKLCQDIVVPLIQKEEAALSGMGEQESKELLRLLSLYSRCYCEGVKELGS